MTNEKKLIQFVKKTIKGTEFENHVFLAGGFVRDEIMNKSPKDIDFVIDLPEGGIKFANWITKLAGCFKENSNPVIFPKFGTAKFNFRNTEFSNIDIECVMTREEKYEANSRKPEVEFTPIKNDVFRRDLTINSLVKNVSNNKIIDFTEKGRIDIVKGLLRTPLNPDVTFTDDPLRMLRVIRFASKLGFKIDVGTALGINKNADMITTISSERIQEELNKMLLTDEPSIAFDLLRRFGLLKHIIPELIKTFGLEQNKFHLWDVWTHTMKTVNAAPKNLIVKWAALLHDIGKVDTKTETETGIHFFKHEVLSGEIAEKILRRLKFSNDFIKEVVLLVNFHMKLKQEIVTNKSLRKFIVKVGDSLDNILNLMQADITSHGTKFDDFEFLDRIKKQISNLVTIPKKPNLPINGNDIMLLFGIKSGPMVGEKLKIIEDVWFENPRITKTEAIEILKNIKG